MNGMRNHHPRIIGFFTRALAHEYTAVQQYRTQSSLCTLWGMADWAEYFRNESREELDHAGILSQQLLLMGIAPTGAQLRPPRPGRDLREMLTHDQDLEFSAVQLYSEAQNFSERMRDIPSAEVFAHLRADEEGHMRSLAEMLERFH